MSSTKRSACRLTSSAASSSSPSSPLCPLSLLRSLQGFEEAASLGLSLPAHGDGLSDVGNEAEYAERVSRSPQQGSAEVPQMA